MYILENTCGILTTKKEFQAVKNAESMSFICHPSKNFVGVYQEVAYATKTAPNTYTVEIVTCWVYAGPNEHLIAVECEPSYKNPEFERTVKNVKAKSKKDAIMSVVRKIVYLG
jgi:hypothetical protein